MKLWPTPKVQSALREAVAAYKESIETSNLAVAIQILDYEANTARDRKLKLLAIDFIRGPLPMANDVRVNVEPKVNKRPATSAGYIARFGPGEPRPETAPIAAEAALGEVHPGLLTKCLPLAAATHFSTVTC